MLRSVTYCYLWAFWFKFLRFLCWLWKFLQPLTQRHIQQMVAGGQLTNVPFQNGDSNLESLCEWKKNENRGQNLAGKRCSDLAWNLATWQKQSGIVEYRRRGTCDRWEWEKEGPLLEKQCTKRHSQPRSLLPLVEREKGSDKGLRLDQLGVKSRAVPAG